MDKKAVASRAKVLLQQNRITRRLYAALKECKDTKDLQNNLKGRFSLCDRSRGADTLCLVLAGYKPFLYSYVFARLAKFVPESIDVCIVTAGKHDADLWKLCVEHGWSYLSTQNNNVALAQNLAIHSFPKAQYIFKLDEDIFVTEGYFESMRIAFEHACAGPYVPGVIAPLLPVNGYGYMRILERYDMLEEYEQRFERPCFAAGPDRWVENDVAAARFLWGEDGCLPGLDQMAMDAASLPLEESPCAIRFSIGAILFERSVWEDMGYFEVNHGFVGLGLDERQLCTWCVINSRPIMVSQNVVVGHFGFGSQTDGMRSFLDENPQMFSLPT